MPIARRRTWLIWSSASLAAVAAATWWGLLAHRSLGHRVGDCIWQQKCDSISLRADDRVLAAADVEAIFRLPAIRRACQQVRRCYSVEAPDEKPHLILTGMAGSVELAHHIIVPTNEPDSVLVGSLLIKLLTIEHLWVDPSLRNMGDLNALLATDFDTLARQLKSLGVTRIDLAGTQCVPIEEAAAALRRLGEYNKDTPIRLLKP